MKRDGETGRQYRSATGHLVVDKGYQGVVGAVDGVIRAMEMRIARVQKPPVSVYDMCKAGHRVVCDIDSNGTDQSYALNLKTGEKTIFKLRSRIRELDMRVIPVRQTAEVLQRESKPQDLCPLGGQIRRP